MKYIKNFKAYNEAIVDKISKNLSDIFENGQLKTEVKDNIKKGLTIIKKEFPSIEILEYYLVGAAITYQYKDSSDIDTTVVISKNTSEDDLKKVDKWIEKNLDNKMFFNKRPYQFKVAHTFPKDNFDAIYDVENDKWVKSIQGEQLTNMKSVFKKKILDKESAENKKYTELENKIQDGLKKLHDRLKNNQVDKNDIDSVHNIYKNDIKSLRKNAYSAQIQTGVPSRNWMFGNVIYKMFDREGYSDLFELLKRIDKENGYNDGELLNELKDKIEELLKNPPGFDSKGLQIQSQS